MAAVLLLARQPGPGPAVELAVDLGAVRRFAAIRNLDPGRILDRFREAGATSALVGEKTLYDLLQQGQAGYPPAFRVSVQVIGGGEAAARARLDPAFALPPEEVRADETYVFVRDNPELAAWLESALRARLGAERVRRTAARGDPSLAVLAVQAPIGDPDRPWASALLVMPLGHLPADADLVRRHGLAVAYGVGNPFPSLVRAPLRPADPAAPASALEPGRPVYPEGAEVPGYPGRAVEFGAALAGRGAILAVPVGAALPVGPGGTLAAAPGGPLGLRDLAGTPGLSAVRAHRTVHGEGPADWLRLAAQDGVRLFVFGLWPESAEPEADLARQTAALRSLRAALPRAGLRPGVLGPGQGHGRPGDPRAAGTAGGVLLALAGAGAAASFVHLLLRFWTPGPDHGVAAYAAVTAAALGVVAWGTWLAAAGPPDARELAARLPLVTWPALGVMGAASLGLDAQVKTAALVARQGARAFDPGPLGDRIVLGQMLLRLVPYAAAGGLAARALAGSLPEPVARPGAGLALLPVILYLVHWAWLRGPRAVRDLARAGDRPVRAGPLLVLAAAVALAGVVALDALLTAQRSAEAARLADTAPPPTAPGAPVTPEPVPSPPGVAGAFGLWAPRPVEVLLAYPALGAAGWLLRRGRSRPGLWAVALGGLAAGTLATALAGPWSPLGREALREAAGLVLGTAAGLAVQDALRRRAGADRRRAAT
ncbi:DUF5693 family protein [Caldinitratiruptor microaerophilus]|uniref:DUF5693 family protein n=1 Tax=Caldinitratiruptor microaerophilus TaxID=671077 RepID=UPI002230D4AB|nr:DUF5693 family protein [Caldinitratiruptor microaerophilus]